KENVTGWTKHPKRITGRPDFYFSKIRLAVFVDGCFWHSCPRCGRLPKSRIEFWANKIETNRLRDNRVRKQLRGEGIATLRIWEHELARSSWLKRLRTRIIKLSK